VDRKEYVALLHTGFFGGRIRLHMASLNPGVGIQPGNAIFRNFKLHALSEINGGEDNGGERHQYQGDGSDADSQAFGHIEAFFNVQFGCKLV
jgi:hypothetical protein